MKDELHLVVLLELQAVNVRVPGLELAASSELVHPIVLRLGEGAGFLFEGSGSLVEGQRLLHLVFMVLIHLFFSLN